MGEQRADFSERLKEAIDKAFEKATESMLRSFDKFWLETQTPATKTWDAEVEGRMVCSDYARNSEFNKVEVPEVVVVRETGYALKVFDGSPERALEEDTYNFVRCVETRKGDRIRERGTQPSNAPIQWNTPTGIPPEFSPHKNSHFNCYDKLGKGTDVGGYERVGTENWGSYKDSGSGGGPGQGCLRTLDIPRFDRNDSDGWIRRVEQLLYVYRVSESELLKVIEMAFVGDVLQWYQWENKRRPFRCWSDLKMVILRQYSSSTYQNFNGSYGGYGGNVGRSKEGGSHFNEYRGRVGVNISGNWMGSQTSSQYQEDHIYGAYGQEIKDAEYWEKRCPGWKYDRNTGRWCQVKGYDSITTATTSVDTSVDTTVRNETTEVSYLQQYSQSGGGIVAQNAPEKTPHWSQVSQTTDNNERMSNWNQVPAGYYNTIDEDWRYEDTCIPSPQSAVQPEKQLNKNGFASIDTSQIDDQKTLGVHGQVGHHVVRGFNNQSQDYSGQSNTPLECAPANHLGCDPANGGTSVPACGAPLFSALTQATPSSPICGSVAGLGCQVKKPWFGETPLFGDLSAGPLTLKVSHGGSRVTPYTETVKLEPDSRQSTRCMSISAMPIYQDYTGPSLMTTSKIQTCGNLVLQVHVSKDIPDLLKQAVRDVEDETRTVADLAENDKAVGDSAVEVFKTAAVEVYKETNEREISVFAASKAQSTVIDAENAVEVSRKLPKVDASLANSQGAEPEKNDGDDEFSIPDSGSLAHRKERSCIQCLQRLGEYAEVLGMVLTKQRIDICLKVLQRSSRFPNEPTRGLFLSDVGKLLSILSAHRKLAAVLVDRGDMQKLLKGPGLAPKCRGKYSGLFTTYGLKMESGNIDGNEVYGGLKEACSEVTITEEGAICATQKKEVLHIVATADGVVDTRVGKYIVWVFDPGDNSNHFDLHLEISLGCKGFQIFVLGNEDSTYGLSKLRSGYTSLVRVVVEYGLIKTVESFTVLSTGDQIFKLPDEQYMLNVSVLWMDTWDITDIVATWSPVTEIKRKSNLSQQKKQPTILMLLKRETDGGIKYALIRRNAPIPTREAAILGPWHHHEYCEVLASIAAEYNVTTVLDSLFVGKQECNAQSVSTDMYMECQELLQMCGLPYIIASGTAKAQSAVMELEHLVRDICVPYNLGEDETQVWAAVTKTGKEQDEFQDKVVADEVMIGIIYACGRKDLATWEGSRDHNSDLEDKVVLKERSNVMHWPNSAGLSTYNKQSKTDPRVESPTASKQRYNPREKAEGGME